MIFKSISKYKKVFENTVALTIVNGLNIIFPLILTPYLLNVIGNTEYGKWVFSQVFIQYGIVSISYGFQFSATKELSRSSSSYEQSRLFFSVFYTKILIAILYTIFYLAIVVSIPKIREESLLFLFGIGVIWGQAFMPIWFFLGVERMKFISLTNFVAKLIIAVSIFIMIRHTYQYIFINLIYSVGNILAGLISFGFAIYKFKIRFVAINKNDIIRQFKSGWNVFISTFFINLYRNANTFILGFTTTYDFVTFYNIAEKIIKALQAIINPLSQALFPHFSKRSTKISPDKFKNEILRLSKYYFIVLFLISIAIIMLAPLGIRLYLGYEDINIIQDLRIMSFIVVFGGINYLLGFVGMVNMEKENDFRKLVIFCGLLNIVLAIPISYFFKDKGLAYLLVFIELFLFLILLRKIKRI